MEGTTVQAVELTLEELEAQAGGLLPDRVEMRRRRRRRRRAIVVDVDNTAEANATGINVEALNITLGV